MPEGEGADIIPFTPRSPDAAAELRKKLTTSPEGTPLEILDPRIEAELLDRIPALEAAHDHAQASLDEEVERISDMWGETFSTISSSPGAENFLPVVREAERTLIELRKKVTEAKERLNELKQRIEDIQTRLREQRGVAQGGQ